MKALSYLIVLLVVAAAAAWAGYEYARRHAEAHDPATTEPSAAEEETKPVAEVEVAPVRVGPIAEFVSAYGTVTSQPGEVRIITAAFESQVVRLLVNPGQAVTEGMPLLELEASPETLVALQEAKNAAEAAGRDLKQTQQRFSEHLATNQDLSAAEAAATGAELKRKSLLDRGVGEKQQLKAANAGVVSKIDVQEGQIVPAGTALVEIAAERRVEVKLGVEPGDIAVLKPDQPVHLRPMDGSADQNIDGKVRLIGRRVDPTTRLVDVLVSLPPDANLLLETYVAAQIESTKKVDSALLVPTNAALPDEGEEHKVFTIKDGHAKKHSVKVGLENTNDVQIITDELHEGDEVIVLGNFELEDGMAVEVKGSATQPATEPTTAPAPAETKP